MGDRRAFPNAGDILHIVQIATLIATLGMGYQQFQDSKRTLETHGQKLDRIEHYIESKDPSYWRKVKENGDNK